MPLKILITGRAGLLAPYLAEAAGSIGTVSLTSRSQVDFVADLTSRDQVDDLIAQASPDVVIHAAAWTNVDECQQASGAAHSINAGAVKNLALALPYTSRLMMISTDQVYPATDGPHPEGTEDPVNAYGKSKLAGEHAALGHPRGSAIRTSFFGPSRTAGRKSLSDFVVDNLKRGTPFTAFSDLQFSPLHAATLANLVCEMIGRDLTGVFNVGSREGFSKASFGAMIATHLGLSDKYMKAGRSSDHPARAPRALDLRLDTRKFETALGRDMPTLANEIAKL